MRFAKAVAVISAVAVVALGAWSYSSPKLAARHLRDVARAGDREDLRDAVNFPAVREGLKEDLKAYLATQMQSDPELHDNPFAGLGLMFASALVDRMVEGFVTPSSIALLASGGKPSLSESGSGATTPDSTVVASGGYHGLSRYEITFRNRRTREPGPTLVFERAGLTSWRLVRLDLPLEEAAREQQKRRAEASLKSDLMNLQMAEEIYYAATRSHGSYTANLSALDYAPSTGNAISITAATAGGFAAIGSAQSGGSTTYRCALYTGNVPPTPPATVTGVVACQ